MKSIRCHLFCFIIVFSTGFSLFIPFSPTIHAASEIGVLNATYTLQFDSSNSYAIVEKQLSFGNRIPGTQASVNCGNYFTDYVNSISTSITAITHNLTVETTDCRNYLFKINSNEEHIVILGAHYDSRAISEKDPDPTKRDEPCPGANDGASGVAVLLELCDVFYANRENLNCTLWIILFDAEDQGSGGISGWGWCEGSSKFAADIDNYYKSDTQTIDAMILLDLVGGTNLKFIKETRSTQSLLSDLFETGRSLGYSDEFPLNPTTGSVYDDHVPFIEIGIPSADLIIQFWNAPSAWPYHHTTSDTLTYISQESLEITGKTIERFIYDHYWISADASANTQDTDWRNTDNLGVPDALIFVILSVVIVGVACVAIFLILKRAKNRAFEEEYKLK
jgi:glutaminyl-peptide cyclotransferase